MSELPMSDRGSISSSITESPTALPTVTSPLHRVRRLLPLLAIASALVLVMSLVLHNASPLYALITFPHNPDFTATGEGPLQQFGFAVASAGDINNDGFGDVVAGADLANKFYVYKGSVAGLTTTVFFSDTGSPGENLGWSVAGGGDATGDDVDDLVVGTPINAAGAAYLYQGSSVGFPTRIATLTGELASDEFGWSVDIIGDINHDGIDDIAIGAPEAGPTTTGRVYIYHGPVVGNPIAPSLILYGEASNDFFGVSVSGAGDVNGDGIDDLVVGARENDDGGSDAGKAYLFKGSPTGLHQSDFNSIVGTADDQLGISVHGAGDVNGDGYDDVIVGADATNPGDPTPGYFSVYPGSAAGLMATPLFTKQGEGENDRFGFAVAGNGDLDGDGFADFAVGAYDFDINPLISVTNEGKAYGYVACNNGTIAPTLLFSDTGDIIDSGYGHSLAIVGDVNNDGADDLVVGAYTVQPLSTGQIYAYYGVNEGGCRPALELSKTVELANYPGLITPTTKITVPTDAAIRYVYTIRNTGNVTLTQHQIVDDKLGPIQTAHTLTPGANVSIDITNTPGVSMTPGVSITNVATWTGSISITSPSDVTTPTNRVLSASALSSALVNISGPATDQDGDTIPDNVEGSRDEEPDGLPNYLDFNSDDDDYPDEEEVGPDPTNPIDRDEDGTPGYRDEDENPTTVPPPTGQPITGLTIHGPETSLVGQNVNFNATVTAGGTVSYTWAFGDGEDATGPAVSHTYSDPDLFSVVVTATNGISVVTATKEILVMDGTLIPLIYSTGQQ